MERIISDSGKYFAVIKQDEFVGSPRKEWDHLGVLVYPKRSEYALGDEAVDPEDWEWPANAVVLPVYLLDHSGVWLSTERFACDPQGWDSGLYGYIYADRDKARDEWGLMDDAQIIKELRQEIEELSQWLSGDVWITSIYEVPEGKEAENVCLHCAEPIDCCGGFYGYKFAEESVREQFAIYEKKGM